MGSEDESVESSADSGSVVVSMFSVSPYLGFRWRHSGRHVVRGTVPRPGAGRRNGVA